MAQAVFERRNNAWHPTEAARGPWDPRAQHGGAPSALFAHIAETEAPGMMLTRLTVELVKPVPVAPLTSRTEVNAGRSTTRVTIDLLSGDVLVARAHALLMQSQPLELPDDVPGWTPDALLPGPEGLTTRLRLPGTSEEGVSFLNAGMDHRLAQGDSMKPGAGGGWFRVAIPIVDGEPISPAMRVAAAADFGNGLSWVVPADEYLFSNPDLSVHLHRHPIGEWVGLLSQTQADASGFGTATSLLFDEHGPIGTSTQSLLMRKRR